MANTDIVGSVNNVLQSLDAAGQGMIGTLGGTGGLGFQLLGVIFGIMFFYNMIIFLLEGNGRIMVDITKLTITWVILASMLAAWTSPASEGFMKNTSVTGFFVNTIPGLANSFTGGTNPTATIVDKHVSAMGNVFKVLMKEKSFEAEAPEGQRSVSERVMNFADGMAFNIKQSFNLISDISGTFVSFFILVLAAFFILWSLLTFVFVLNAGQVMLYIGLALGPVLIPFLLIQNLSFLFNGWLRFMISAALYKVVAVLVALLCLSTIDQITNYSANMATGDESMIFLSLMVLFFAMLGKQLMGLSDNIASTIASGGANSGGSGDSGKILMTIARGRMGGEKTPPPQDDLKPKKGKE